MRPAPLLYVALPIAAHLTATASLPGLATASGYAFAMLLVLALFSVLRLHTPWAVLIAAGFALAMTVSQSIRVLLYLLPTLVDVWLASVFGRTLRRGREPLIESVIRCMRPPDEPLDPATLSYARRSTLAWMALFLVLALLSLVLAACVRPGGLFDSLHWRAPFEVGVRTWSLGANLFNYLAVVAFFCAEHLYRRHRFPRHRQRSLGGFVRSLAARLPDIAERTLQTRGRSSVSAIRRAPRTAEH
jgi:uncharacterized membrane protein